MLWEKIIDHKPTNIRIKIYCYVKKLRFHIWVAPSKFRHMQLINVSYPKCTLCNSSVTLMHFDDYEVVFDYFEVAEFESAIVRSPSGYFFGAHSFFVCYWPFFDEKCAYLAKYEPEILNVLIDQNFKAFPIGWNFKAFRLVENFERFHWSKIFKVLIDQKYKAFLLVKKLKFSNWTKIWSIPIG